MTEKPQPARALFFSLADYEEFEAKLKEAGRSRFLFIQGRRIVNVDSRSADCRDKALCVGKFTIKNLPHYEGLLSQIHKVAVNYEQTIFKI